MIKKVGQMLPAEMLAHVKELAEKNNILLRLEAPSINNCKAYALAKPQRVVTLPVTTPARYAIALHELGHCLSPVALDLTKKQGNQLTEEAEAWRWALDRIKVELSDPQKRQLGKYLQSYHDRWAGEAKKSRGTLKLVEPPEDSIYWQMMKWAEPPAKKARFLP